MNELEKLEIAVHYMDSLSQNGFSKIEAIAKLALAYMRTPDGYSHPENIARALKSIWETASDTMSLINVEAEEVGQKYVDTDARQRLDACYASQRRLA